MVFNRALRRIGLASEGGGEDENGDELEDEVTEISQQELRKQAIQEQRHMDRLETQVSQHQGNYRDHLEEGAQANDKGTRRVSAIRARFEKFKAKIKELRRLKSLQRLSKLTLAQQTREIEDMLADVQAEDQLEVALKAPQEIQEEIDLLVADAQADLEQMGDVMEATEVDLGGFDLELTEEEAIMDSIRKGDASLDDVAIDLDLDMGVGVDEERDREFESGSPAPALD